MLQRQQVAVGAATSETLFDVQAVLILVSFSGCIFSVLFSMTSRRFAGLPAFKPGEKVEIDLGMDDI
jgi:hypothetical protein